LGGFLIYAERSVAQNQSLTTKTDKAPLLVKDGSEDGHQRLSGLLKKSSHFNPESLVKKTITVKSNDSSGTILALGILLPAC
jgi:hypothetical protein